MLKQQLSLFCKVHKLGFITGWENISEQQGFKRGILNLENWEKHTHLTVKPAQVLLDLLILRNFKHQHKQASPSPHIWSWNIFNQPSSSNLLTGPQKAACFHYSSWAVSALCTEMLFSLAKAPFGSPRRPYQPLDFQTAVAERSSPPSPLLPHRTEGTVSCAQWWNSPSPGNATKPWPCLLLLRINLYASFPLLPLKRTESLKKKKKKDNSFQQYTFQITTGRKA